MRIRTFDSWQPGNKIRIQSRSEWVGDSEGVVDPSLLASRYPILVHCASVLMALSLLADSKTRAVLAKGSLTVGA